MPDTGTATGSQMGHNTVDILQTASQLLSTGVVGAAADMLEEFVAEHPDNQEALELICRAYLLLNDSERASAFSQKLLNTRPSNLDSLQAQSYGAEHASYITHNAFDEHEYYPGMEYEASGSEGMRDREAESFAAEEIRRQSDADIDAYDQHELDITTRGLWSSSDVGDGWESVIFDEYFIDVEDEQVACEQFEYTGRLTPTERARQIVGEMAVEIPIEEELFDVLVECLAFHNCHGQTRRALHNLLALHPLASELALVFELRAYWRDRDAFSRTYYGKFASVGTDSLSWSLGIAIARRFRMDDLEEVISLMEDCFEDWSTRASLILRFNSFRQYMTHLVEHMVTVSPDDFPAYIDYRYFPDEEALARDFPGSILCAWLEEHNLLHYQVCHDTNLWSAYAERTMVLPLPVKGQGLAQSLGERAVALRQGVGP